MSRFKYPIELVKEIERVYQIKVSNHFLDTIQVSILPGGEEFLIKNQEKSSIFISQFVLGKLYLVQNKFTEAKLFFTRAAEEAKRLRQESILVWSHLFLAYIALREDNTDAAAKHFLAASGGNAVDLLKAIKALVNHQEDCPLSLPEKYRVLLVGLKPEIQNLILNEKQSKEFNEEIYLLLGKTSRSLNELEQSKKYFQTGYIEFGSLDCFLEYASSEIRPAFDLIERWLSKTNLDLSKKQEIRRLFLNALKDITYIETIYTGEEKRNFESFYLSFISDLYNAKKTTQEENELFIDFLINLPMVSKFEGRSAFFNNVILAYEQGLIRIDFFKKVFAKLCTHDFKFDDEQDREFLSQNLFKQILFYNSVQEDTDNLKEFFANIIRAFFLQSLSSKIYKYEQIMQILYVLENARKQKIRVEKESENQEGEKKQTASQEATKDGESEEKKTTGSAKKEFEEKFFGVDIFSSYEIQNYLREFAQNPSVDVFTRRDIIKKIAILQKLDGTPDQEIYETLLQIPYVSMRRAVLEELNLITDVTQLPDLQIPEGKYWFPTISVKTLDSLRKVQDGQLELGHSSGVPECTLALVAQKYGNCLVVEDGILDWVVTIIIERISGKPNDIALAKSECLKVLKQIHELPKKAQPKYYHVKRIATESLGGIYLHEKNFEEAYRYFAQARTAESCLKMAEMICDDHVKEKDLLKVAVFLVVSMKEGFSYSKPKLANRFRKCFEFLYKKDPNICYAFLVLLFTQYPELKSNIQTEGGNFLNVMASTLGRDYKGAIIEKTRGEMAASADVGGESVYFDQAGVPYVSMSADTMGYTIVSAIIDDPFYYFRPLTFNPFSENLIEYYFNYMSFDTNRNIILLNLLKTAIKESLLPRNVAIPLLNHYIHGKFNDAIKAKALFYLAKVYGQNREDLLQDGILLQLHKLNKYRYFKYKSKFKMALIGSETQESEQTQTEHKILKLRKQACVLLEESKKDKTEKYKTLLIYEGMQKIHESNLLEGQLGSNNSLEVTHSKINILSCLDGYLVRFSQELEKMWLVSNEIRIKNTLLEQISCLNVIRKETDINSKNEKLSTLLKTVVRYISLKMNQSESIHVKNEGKLHQYFRFKLAELEDLGKFCFGEEFWRGIALYRTIDGGQVPTIGSILPAQMSELPNEESTGDLDYEEDEKEHLESQRL